MHEQELYKKAEKRVKKKKRFYKHVKAFLIVNCFFLFMGIIEGDPFEVLPIPFFWGMGLMFHYINVFGFPGSGILSEEWEDAEIQKEMNNIRKHLPNQLPPQEGKLNMDEHLQLKELQKRYDEGDLV